MIKFSNINYKLSIYLILVFCLFLTCNRKKKLEFEISPEGGSYEFKNGIIMVVPAGAVDSKINVKVSFTNDYDAAEVLNPLDVDLNDIICSVEALPSELEFNFPVQLMISGVQLEEGSIPIVHQVDYDAYEYFMPVTTVMYDPHEYELSFSAYHFSDYVIHTSKQFKSAECEINPCRCGTIKIEQLDLDYSCSGIASDLIGGGSVSSCNISESKVRVEFLECNTVEEAIFKEVSPGCKPKLTLTAAERIIARNERTDIKSTVMLGCKPIEDQSVDFFHDELGTLYPSYMETDENGNASIVFTAGDTEGTSRVQARATVSYYTYEIIANGEEYHSPLITEELKEDIDIIIKDSTEIYQVDIDISAQNAQRSPEHNWYYDMSLTYSAHMSFEVILPKGDTGTIDISGIYGTGTQTLGSISVSKNDIPFQFAHCLSAQLAGSNFPPSYSFKTDYSWVNTQTKEAELAIQHPTHIHDFGGGCCWASWNINLVIEYSIGETTFTNNEEVEDGLGCLHPLESGTNPPFSVKFEDGYTEHGVAWMGVLLEPFNYILTITQLQ
ncbi:MAG: hypothetical protein JW965_04225 [Bacteroidales bacterium]|nr:hypothetical protein [Bacteroidales bacterium]